MGKYGYEKAQGVLVVERRDAALVKEKQRLFELWKRPEKCRRGCRCEKTDKRKLCRRGKEARGWTVL